MTRFSMEPAPHWRPMGGVSDVMLQVILALIPAMLAWVYYFGPGFIINAVLAVAFAVGLEALMLTLRGRPVLYQLQDLSAVVTALLFVFAMPPLTPWWVIFTGMFFAIVVAKHVYGGIGQNVLNPAMVGYAVVLLSFPETMTAWLPPRIGDIDYVAVDIAAQLSYAWSGQLPAGMDLDAVTRATPLDTVKTELGMMRTMDEMHSLALLGSLGGIGWEWIGNYIALGGFYLYYRGIVRWEIPVGVLAGLLFPAGIAWMLDTATHASPTFHLFSGAAILCAFFIATDPVSAPSANRARLIYGLGIGVLIFVFRTWGSYPDGVAFAVLLMNAAVPLLDRYLTPRVKTA